MADLANNQVEVNEALNSSRFGPSGTRARSEDSSYFNVGGSTGSIYEVTLNWASTNKHWCNCKGNLSKKRKFGRRDANNAEHWCKHVNAARNEPELIQIARDLTEQAFHPSQARPTLRVASIRERVAPESTPAPVAVPEAVVAQGIGSKQERLAALVAEAQNLRDEIEIEEAAELSQEISKLVRKFGTDKVRAAIN